MEVEFRKFEKSDYMAFAGAEGENPCIAYAGAVIVVLGGTVLEVYVVDIMGEDGDQLCYSLDVRGLTPLGAAAILLAVPDPAAGPDGADNALKALGFSVQSV